MKNPIPCLQAALLLLSSLPALHAQAVPDYHVTWSEPGKSYKDSMPAGNGDIGINLWTEENGDVVFLISKTDAWTENGQLVKLGRVRVKLSPSPFGKGSKDFTQTLLPRKGRIEIKGNDGTTLQAWVDANAPVIHIEQTSGKPVKVEATAEIWRTEPRKVVGAKGNQEMGKGFRELNGNPEGGVVIEPDMILPSRNNQLFWLHHNTRSILPSLYQNQHLETLKGKYPDPLLHRNFGVLMRSRELTAEGNLTLKSPRPLDAFRLDLHVLTNQSEKIEIWQKAIQQQAAKTDARPIAEARAAHESWWDQFWNRSWIHASGDDSASSVTQGYAMQRWMTAGSGRGAQPLKFNGGIFCTGQEQPGKTYDPEKGREDADYRAWGSNYWFQNQRLVYWPMIAQGDLDTLMPFFQMYVSALPLAKDRIKAAYQHDGAVFPETMFFFGLPNNNDYGWGNDGMELKNTWIRHHWNSALELTTMLLDTYDATTSQPFAKNMLLPIATEVTTFFDVHWKRVDGKIFFDKSQALETRQQAENPAQDIAGLMHILPRLIALPENLTTAGQREQWKKTLADLPPLPRGRTNAEGLNPQSLEEATPSGKEILYSATKFSRTANSENPELYAIFPFRLYGVNLPDLDLANATYDAKRFVSSTCWGQDGIQAAYLGRAELAKKEAIANFTAYGWEKYKWFWKPGHDWEPDYDNGGAGQVILQSMLMQPRGDKILLFPAWPKAWNVSFKLHASKNTTIEGVYQDGRIEKLTVTPPSRAKDVIQLTPQ